MDLNANVLLVRFLFLETVDLSSLIALVDEAFAEEATVLSQVVTGNISQGGNIRTLLFI